jgi:16S rRNA (guanine966-N2)-methyltransferase
MSPQSTETRPTSDRLRETLFNVIAPRIKGVRFLDLCAGSAAVGIEAMSRGADHATFVDRSRKMCGLIESNLDLCRITDGEVAVVTADAFEFLRKAVKRQVEAWDIIFFDPPYSENYLPVLEALGGSASELLSPEGLLVIEHHHKTQLPDETGALIRQRVLKQGESALSFYGRGDTIPALDHLAVH